MSQWEALLLVQNITEIVGHREDGFRRCLTIQQALWLKHTDTFRRLTESEWNGTTDRK